MHTPIVNGSRVPPATGGGLAERPARWRPMAQCERLSIQVRMRQCMRALRIVLVVFVVACAPAHAQQQAPLTIRGRVFAAENREALPRARITITIDRDTMPTVYADDRGEFSIAAPSAASFTLSVVKAKFAMTQM